ncbi:MAG: DUF4465 domain-containing protein [Verrucomicrobiota bacterium]|jgi:hypothetical protein|nr:DUF4465 domain-containing protein [Verrucomicrobiota bacterium]
MRHIQLSLGLLFLCVGVSQGAQALVSFDRLLPEPEHVINDAPAVVDNITLNNTLTDWGGTTSWSGYALSTMTHEENGAPGNPYAAAAPLNHAYAVAYDNSEFDPSPTIRFAIPASPHSIRLNNTANTAAVLRNGDRFARPFSDGDVFWLTLTAYDADGRPLGTLEHLLADFRDGHTFIQTNWTTLDLTSFGHQVVDITAVLSTTDVGAYGPNTPMYFALADIAFAYSDGSDGIASTHPNILCWASDVADYAPGPGVSNHFANATNALGPAWSGDGENGGRDVVSLGDNGTITLIFPIPITDGRGPDFVVFENAFDDTFLELAYVEVSSDGEHFVRFPSHSLETRWLDTYGITNVSDPTAYGGFAGKHVQGVGTPFDLALLAGNEQLDIHRITHVRLVDVLGDGRNMDHYAHPVFDPTPTWGSAGFDLDAVGVLNPWIEITTKTNEQPPLPNFTLEHTARLDAPDWQPAIDRNTPGFYRYRLSPRD